MITRRNLMATFAATGAGILHANGSHFPEEPLPPLPMTLRIRKLHLTPEASDTFVIATDAPIDPPALIKPEVVDDAFGAGTHRLLSQPDHWRMIEAGWFSGNDLYLPYDIDDPAYRIWCAYYAPKTEAHDLLLDLFGGGLMPGGGTISELGLSFAEHPCTPRLAMVKLINEFMLPQLQAEVSALTKWIEIEPLSQNVG